MALPSTPTPIPAAAALQEPDPSPLPLWIVLEEEFRDLHGDALELDAAYEKTRNDNLKAARKAVEDEILLRTQKRGETLTSDELATEIEDEIQQKPELINGAGCKELFQRIHRFVEARSEDPFAHSALCLSGGGIRSATFGLGILQGLAEKKVLKKFAYLSTVSGGGYIGSWLSAWIRQKGAAKVYEELGAQERSAADTGIPKDPLNTESAPIRYLRQYSNYLTPSLGLLSGDGLAVAATVARNLFLNWLLIIPVFLFALLLPRAALGLELHGLGREKPAGEIAAGAAFLCGVYALTNLVMRRDKTQKDVLLRCVLPFVLFSAFATLAWFWARLADPEHGFFTVDWHRPIFYMAWGGLTAALAAFFGFWQDKDEQPCNPFNSFCLIVVFSLSGLAACGVGQIAARYLPSVPYSAQNQSSVRPQAQSAQGLDVAPAPATPAPVTLAPEAPPAKPTTPHRDPHTTSPAPKPTPTWAFVARQKENQGVSTWEQLDSTKPDARKWMEHFWEDKPPKSGRERWLGAAILCVCFGFPLLIALIFMANTVLTGLLSSTLRDEDREWLARASGWALLGALAVCVFDLLVLFGPIWLAFLWENWPKVFSTIAGASALFTIGGGQHDNTAATSRGEQKPATTDRILGLLARVAAPLFVIILIMLFSLLSTLLLHQLARAFGNEMSWTALQHNDLRSISVAALFFALIAFISTRCVSINKFSLHAMYRNRLIRAFLGATNEWRKPNCFTGFDPRDNLALSSLRGQRPFHVLNMALNLVSGKELAWQQRLAMSYTMTPRTCGSAALGYRDSLEYGRGRGPTGVTLGTALSISGAAVSPNHGYNSSPLVAFILTFFNARLGGWFGNPGPAGNATWKRASPLHAMQPIIAEAFGFTDSEHPYVYLSDGGHFENLGLYEMVLRRCRTIVVSDAGCDPEYWFEDLGNAISKIRVDFGIRIKFEKNIEIRKPASGPREAGQPTSMRYAVAKIYYSDVDGSAPGQPPRDGTLIYIKPAMRGTEPMDVFHYSREHPEFPHEPTTDQWFSELQFESYRMLGYHSIQEVFGSDCDEDLAAILK